MKGIVRKLDELGRIVIPKEMRRILNIAVGSSIEMVIDENNEVVLKKFSEVENILPFAQKLADVVNDCLFLPALVCDEEKVVACSGVNKKDFLNKKLKFEKKDFAKNHLENKFVESNCLIHNSQKNFEKSLVFAITSDGFVCGFLVVLSQKEIDDENKKMLKLLCTFLSGIVSF